MSSINQNLILEYAATPFQPKDPRGNSNVKSLKQSFPGSPSLESNSKTVLRESNLELGETISLDKQSYRAAYAKFIMSGIRQIPGGDFSLVDMDYGTNPDNPVRGLGTPPNQSNVATAVGDNTIAPSGLGPNVATLNIDSADNPGEGASVVEPQSTSQAPFVGNGSESPAKTAAKIAKGGISGGPTLYGPGDLGKSEAS